MRVAIDTNVLVAALRSKRGAAFQVLRLMRNRRFEFVLSVPLFLEYEDVLKRAGLVPLPMETIDKLLKLLARNGTPREIFFLWRPFLKDAKDDMVLEVALAGSCAAIVTYNTKDFVGADQLGIEVWTPQEFLRRLQNDPDQSSSSPSDSN